MLDIEAMRSEASPWTADLFPWIEANEIGLLSLKNQTKTGKTSSGKFLKGVYYSIYDEPMMVFGIKSYVKGRRDTLMWASTRKHEFVFRGKKDRTEVFIDREAVGHLTGEGLLYGGSHGRLLGRRNNFSEEHYSVVIWDKEVAHLAKAANAERLNTRVFEVLEDMGVKEQLLLIALGFHTIIVDTFGPDGSSKR